MIRSGWAKAALLFTLVFIALACAGRVLAQSLFGNSSTGIGAPDRVALINIEGVITADSGGGGGPFGGATGTGSVTVCDELYEAIDDTSVKAVLLRINSPGGSAAGSDEIYHAIKAVQKSGKKVVASMGDVAASGGYYIASSCDYIYANGATLTGSIGVVFSLVNWGDLASKYGVREESLHAGQYKDIGSPWRPMTDEERGMLKSMLASVHDQFIRAVDEGRQNLNEAQVRKLATGMIFTGAQAEANGLVDAIGGMKDAEAKARELAKLPKDAPVEPLSEPSLLEELLGVSASANTRGTAGAPQALEQLSAAASSGLDGISLLARGLYLNTTLRDLRMR